MYELSVKPAHVAELSPAELGSGLCYRIEHRLEISGRSANDTEHIADCGLIFERLLKLPLARLLRLEQPRVLDGDDGLVGEGLYEVDLSLCERPHRRVRERDDADDLATVQQRHREERSVAARMLSLHIRELWISKKVGYLDRAFL